MNLALTSDCWFVGDNDFVQMLNSGQLVREGIAPYAYFSRQSKFGEITVEGYIGRYGEKEMFHSRMLSNFSYFEDYRNRKSVYLTFDKITLYEVIEIFNSDPLLFTLKRINYLAPDKLMINQESIYQLIYKENWPEIIGLLHKYKEDISSDPILKYAAQTFENVFLGKVAQFTIEDVPINDVLQLLYTIHFGKFYTLSDENLKKLTIELARRTPLMEAYNYAKKYPEDEVCNEVIQRYLKAENKKIKRSNAPISYKWVEIYNRLFSLINNESDSATYFSGPRFINLVKEFDPYFPNYTQYIQLRNEAGQSTTRKLFFYDILMELDEVIRIKAIEKILFIVKPFDPDKIKPIKMLLGIKESEAAATLETNMPDEQTRNPTVFISYSWDDKTHKEWVLKLANKLAANNIKVLLDQFDLRLGRSLPHFVEQSIAHSDRVLIIFSPGYKLKADQRSGGVGYEYSIMNAELYQNQTTNIKIIPVLRIGEMKDSIPTFMQQFIHLDLRNDENFENSYLDLVREIYDEPVIKHPPLGKKPDFK